MNGECPRLSILSNRLPVWLAVGGVLAVVHTAVADVTLEINVGPLAVPAGTVGILVADREGDGFADLKGPRGLRMELSVGETLGWSDDVIVAVIQADAGAHWNGESGFGDVVSELDYESLGVEEGDALTLYWFEDHQQPGENLEHQDSYQSFRSDAASNSGGTIGFVLPADGEVRTIAHLSAAVGGDSDPQNPGPGAVARSGKVGSTVTDLSSGGPLDRLLAPNEVEFFWIDIPGAGGLKVTARGLDGVIAKLFRSDGVELKSVGGSGGGITQLASGVSPGLYFLSIEGESGTVAGRFSVEAEAGNFRPDLTIQKPGTRRFVGANRFNLSGAGQSVTGKTRRGKKVGFATEGINRGSLEDGFTYFGSRSNRYFTVRFFQTKPGRKNVTAGVRKGYDVVGVAPNGKVSVVIEVDPKSRRKPKGPAKKFKGSVQLKSASLPAIQDRVRASLIAR